MHSSKYVANGIQCQPIKEKSVDIDAGKNGVITAAVTEECQCDSDCYRKSYYMKATRVTNETKEVEIDVGVCAGRCSSTGHCRPSITSHYSGSGRLEKSGRPYKPRIIQGCKCIL